MKNDTIVDKIGSLLNPLNFLKKKDPASSPKSSDVKVKTQSHHDLTWIDIENPTRKDLTDLTQDYDFDPLYLRACIASGQLDRLDKEDKYLFVLIRTPKYSKKEDNIASVRICFFVGKKYLITVHRSPHDVLSSLFNECATEETKRDEVFKKSGGHLLFQVLDTLTKDIGELQESVLKEVEQIDDLVFDINVSGVYEIAKLRQKIVRLRRVLTPFKTIVQELANDQSDLTTTLSRPFKFLTNELNKLRDLLDEATETVEIYKDADFTISTERTNKILALLTIIFTLGIPATIIGSFYGMNVLIPGGIEAGSWTILGPFTTFYFVIAAAVLPALVMLIVFKQKKWF